MPRPSKGLGGFDQTKAVRKIPLIGDLPIIGELFKRREFQNSESELVIMVTPEIVGPKTEIQPQQPATLPAPR